MGEQTHRCEGPAKHLIRFSFQDGLYNEDDSSDRNKSAQGCRSVMSLTRVHVLRTGVPTWAGPELSYNRGQQPELLNVPRREP